MANYFLKFKGKPITFNKSETGDSPESSLHGVQGPIYILASGLMLFLLLRERDKTVKMETRLEKENLCFIYSLGCSDYQVLQLEKALIVQKINKK